MYGKKNFTLCRSVCEILKDLHRDLRIQTTALGTLPEVAQAYFIRLLENPKPVCCPCQLGNPDAPRPTISVEDLWQDEVRLCLFTIWLSIHPLQLLFCFIYMVNNAHECNGDTRNCCTVTYWLHGQHIWPLFCFNSQYVNPPVPYSALMASQLTHLTLSLLQWWVSWPLWPVCLLFFFIDYVSSFLLGSFYNAKRTCPGFKTEKQKKELKTK